MLLVAVKNHLSIINLNSPSHVLETKFPQSHIGTPSITQSLLRAFAHQLCSVSQSLKENSATGLEVIS
jgi:hypothetical protein